MALVNHLVDEAMAFASARGLVVGAPGQQPHLLTHVPFALAPSPMPREAVERGLQLAPVFGDLAERIVRDPYWLLATLETAASVDDFTGKLVEIYKRVIAQGGPTQPARLSITRSDYMEDSESGRLLQVELNMIASSFGALSAGVTDLHRHMLRRFGRELAEAGLASGTLSVAELDKRLPSNDAVHTVVGGLAAAHKHYGEPTAHVAFVVQPGERNAADQRMLEYALQADHGVAVTRVTLKDLAERCEVKEDGTLLLPGGAQASVLYFRAGYTPTDYPSAVEWEGRAKAELSRAIKCPSIDYHLVGAKRVQQALAEPGAVERFAASSEEAALLRSVFADQWALDGSGGKEAEQAVAEAKADPSRFVLKPQREGGGNNLYGDEVAEGLTSMGAHELGAYILMQRIFPARRPAVLVKEGRAVEGEAISELGIYGATLADGERFLYRGAGGTLMRTKFADTDEGGVATGFACLDTPYRVDGDGQ